MHKAKRAPVIYWAVDPFTDDYRFLKKTARMLSSLQAKLDAPIRPVYYLESDAIQEYMLKHRVRLKRTDRDINAVRKFVAERIQSIADRMGLRDVLSARLLPDGDLLETSERRKVDSILAAAQREPAKLVVLQSHSRTGISRLLLGSFAETFILKAEIPTLLVPRSSTPTESFKNIVFATDLSPESGAAFKRFVELFEALAGHVTLFHVLERRSRSALLSSPTLDAEFAEELARTRAHAESVCEVLARHARRRGVPANVVVQETSAAQAADAIKRHAGRLKADLLCVASVCGPAVAGFLGSTCRRLARTSRTPLLILHASSVRSDKRRKPR